MIQLNFLEDSRVDRRATELRGAGWRALALASCLLSACGQAPVRLPLQGTESVQAVRESALAAQSAWSFTGRLAVSSSGNAGNARIDWKQDGQDYDIRLSAPITGQGWRLRRTGAGISLDGLEGGTRTGNDADLLLREATGWQIPVSALSSWVRGARATGASDIEFDPSGLPATLRQSGWAVEYRGWTDAATPLPTRVFARQPQASVRLVIERWGQP